MSSDVAMCRADARDTACEHGPKHWGILIGGITERCRLCGATLTMLGRYRYRVTHGITGRQFEHAGATFRVREILLDGTAVCERVDDSTARGTEVYWSAEAVQQLLELKPYLEEK